MSQTGYEEPLASGAQSVELADWDSTVRVFCALFEDLGDITRDEDVISSATRSPEVATGLTLCRDGRLAASMPLHGVGVHVQRLRWNDSRTWIQLLGDGVAYTYRIAPELLLRRSQSGNRNAL